MKQQWSTIADSLRSRMRRLLVMRGLLWVYAVALVLALLAGVIDWWLHLDSPYGRFLTLSGVIVVSLAVLWRVLLKPVLVKLSDVEIARLIESRLSLRGDDLSSAAQFRSAEPNPSLGSPELQRSTIAKADLGIEELEVDRLFTTAPVRRAALAAALASLVALAFAGASPVAARTAVVRLARPFANVPWPRSTRLRLLGSELSSLGNERLRTTAGEPLTVYVENELGPLPDDVTLDLRLPDDARQQQSLRTTLLRDSAGNAHEVGIVPLLAYRGPVRFRVRGGDDAGTAWRTLEVVPAPAVEELSVTVTPPAYSGRDETTFSEAGLIEGLVGSRVTIEGRANKSLASVRLHREGRSPQPMPLADGATRFQTEFPIEEPGTFWYWFELVDKLGLAEPEPPRYELRGIADRPPVVYIAEPASDLTVTPAAALPLRIVARDDLGLAELRLRFTDAAGSGDMTESVRSRAETVPLELSAAGSMDETIETTWELKPLALASGDRLTYWAEASDACDLDQKSDDTPGQFGTSAFRHLSVISASDKKRELAARQSGLLDALDTLRDRQTQTRDITAQLRIQAELAKQLRQDDVDLLNQAEWEQREIGRQVADESSGLAGEVAELRRELETNQIDDPDSVRRLEMLASDLGELAERWLPSSELELARARKLAGEPVERPDADLDPEEDPSQPSDDSVPVNEDALAHLQEAEKAQTSALAILSEAAKTLGGWRQRFHLSSELDALIADQRGVQQQTKDIGRETLAKASSRLTAQQRADLARLSDRQRRLAARLEKLLEPPTTDGPVEQDGDSETQSASMAASLGVRNARARLRQQGTTGDMHQAAESLKRNEIPAAAEAQKNVLEALREFTERLHQTPLNDPQRILTELRKIADDVETLREQQELLTQSSQRALGATADPQQADRLQRLWKQQSDLADAADAMAHRLTRQRHSRAARTADRAARRMDNAESALKQQQPEDVAVNQQEAQDDLDQLAGELASLQGQAEGQLVRQRMQQLAGDLGKLAESQQNVGESTSDLDARQTARGSWSRSLRRELLDLLDRQEQLRAQLTEQQGAVNELPVVRAAMEGAGETMERAANMLDEQNTGPLTVATQRQAALRLLAVVDVISQTDERQNLPRAPSGQQPDDGQPPNQAVQLQIKTQLKLLRRMQADVNRRTTELASAGEPADKAILQQSQQALAKEQGRIAELSRTLLQQLVDARPSRPAGSAERDETP